MATTSTSIRAWAERLLVAEAANESDARGTNVFRVCDKLRASLAQFVGPDGFTALLRRALALARVDVPLLKAAEITAEGHLTGLEEFGGDAKNHVEAATAITAHLLGLLVTFIGEPLTLTLMRDCFPVRSGSTISETEDSNEQRTN
jgi:hypothetical protein